MRRPSSDRKRKAGIGASKLHSCRLCSASDRYRRMNALLCAAINEALWDLEDAVRASEAEQAFDAKFVELARKIYAFNDERARIKKRINQMMNSALHRGKGVPISAMSACPHDRSKLSKISRRARFRSSSTALAVGRSVLTL